MNFMRSIAPTFYVQSENFAALMEIKKNSTTPKRVSSFFFILAALHQMFGLCPRRERGIVSESCSIKPNLDCIYQFPIDLEPNGRPFGFKSIEK